MKLFARGWRHADLSVRTSRRRRPCRRYAHISLSGSNTDNVPANSAPYAQFVHIMLCRRWDARKRRRTVENAANDVHALMVAGARLRLNLLSSTCSLTHCRRRREWHRDDDQHILSCKQYDAIEKYNACIYRKLDARFTKTFFIFYVRVHTTYIRPVEHFPANVNYVTERFDNGE